MYFEVRLERFESCRIPKSNFQIRIYGIRKMTRISIKNTILRIVAQVVVFDRGRGLVPYTMITNLFCTTLWTRTHLHTYKNMHVRMHAHTHGHTCADADTHPDPELHLFFYLFFIYAFFIQGRWQPTQSQLIQIYSVDWTDIYDTHNIEHRTEPVSH